MENIKENIQYEANESIDEAPVDNSNTVDKISSEEEKSETASSSPSPEEINKANAAKSTGNVNDDGMGAAFFTSADVRAMSREQVRRNLSKILKSMESENF